MNIAFIGCGYVAEFYAKTLGNYPELKLVGAYDRNTRNLDEFVRRFAVRRYVSLAELIGDRSIELVLNLTNPRSHYEVTRSCLEAGKHVYSEKPLAMTLDDATNLARLAERQWPVLGVRPVQRAGETAQTLWKAVREGVVGRVRLVYANFDDGMIAPTMSPWKWINESGVPWPAKDEFEVGCTFEHAGYVLTWLGALFGPALTVTSFASCQIVNKGIAVDEMAPDFTVGCIEYGSGVVARVTCGLVAPRDKSMTVVADEGVLFVGNVRDDAAPVVVRKAKLGPWQSRVASRTQWLHRWFEARVPWPGQAVWFQRRYPAVRKLRGRVVGPGKPVDFMRGPAEMAEAISAGRPCRLSGQFAAHIVEIVEALQHPERFGFRRNISTSFPPIQPMPWAR